MELLEQLLAELGCPQVSYPGRQKEAGGQGNAKGALGKWQINTWQAQKLIHSKNAAEKGA